MQAIEYAGGNEANVHSQEVALDDVAWINNSEGQYAKVSNLTSDNSINYNSNESIGEENGRQRNQRSIRKTSRENGQRRNQEDITDSARKEISTGYSKDNISQETIGEALTDIDSKRKTSFRVL